MDYKTIENNPYMGLNNTICKKPKYFCKSHKVWLSEEDAELKGCFHKPTFDMISERKCNWLADSSCN